MDRVSSLHPITNNLRNKKNLLCGVSCFSFSAFFFFSPCSFGLSMFSSLYHPAGFIYGLILPIFFCSDREFELLILLTSTVLKNIYIGFGSPFRTQAVINRPSEGKTESNPGLHIIIVVYPCNPCTLSSHGTAGILQLCNIARHNVVIVYVPIYHAFY